MMIASRGYFSLLHDSIYRYAATMDHKATRLIHFKWTNGYSRRYLAGSHYRHPFTEERSLTRLQGFALETFYD